MGGNGLSNDQRQKWVWNVEQTDEYPFKNVFLRQWIYLLASYLSKHVNRGDLWHFYDWLGGNGLSNDQRQKLVWNVEQTDKYPSKIAQIYYKLSSNSYDIVLSIKCWLLTLLWPVGW